MLAELEAPSLARQFDRLPPHDAQAEIGLLASVILDREAWIQARAIMPREAFFQADHAIIWDTLSVMYEREQGVDAITLRAELNKRGMLEEIGGVATLATILGAEFTPIHAVPYAEVLAEKHRLRSIISLSNDLLRQCYAPAVAQDRSTEILERAAATMAKLSQQGRRNQALHLSVILDEARESMARGPTDKITLGFRGLDDVGGGGLEPGEELLIGARPSVGKSTLARQIWIRAAKAGIPTVLFSLEEGKRKIARNVLSAECRIENRRLRAGVMDENEWREVDAGIAKLRNLPAWEVENMRRVSEIYAETARLVTKEGVKLILIDYLQRLHANGKDSYERAGEASLGVSDMLKELNVAGVLPVQLNRGVESRDDKRPNMSDLRDSGKIEQDADAIIFLHREDYYHISDENYQPTGLAELIISKWRDAERGGTVWLKSEMRYQTFTDPEDDIDPSRPVTPGGVAVNDLPWGNQ